MCRVCKNENFGWRKKCNKCKKPKPEPKDKSASARSKPGDRDDYNSGGHMPGCKCSKCNPFGGVNARSNNSYLSKAMAASRKVASRMNKFE
mmetsp:Transcript_17622/g.31627  ORF Transcript_17622/g.31627 Transcript_17622/m.31627 type:complete len:91 (+) Transcript_17622:764-1036(+)